MNFQVELDTYRGPLELLLYLVRKHEVDVFDIPIAAIADQYIAHLEVLEALSVDDVGDFVEMASTLLEIKSQMVLPRGGEEVEEMDDPRDELVSRLLEFKKYKDAASMLDEQSRSWQQRYARLADDVPPRRIDLGTQPIQEVELWDLVSALGRIMRDNQATQPSSIVYDDTPIHVYMKRIHDRLLSDRQVSLSQMLQPGMHKSAMIGVFLAVLELVRHHKVLTKQDDLHGEIVVIPGDQFVEQFNVANVDAYGDETSEEEEVPSKPR